MKHLSIDGFAGGGGASCGLKMAGIDVTIAINHDPAAIRMHTVNHPKTLHLTEDIFQVDLGKYLDPDDVVDVMWASPDCTSHSKAKGGQPREAGLRILPWAVYRLCKQILTITGHLPSMLFMENVEEIQEWGTLDKAGRIIPEKKGKEYCRFISSMKKLGFSFDCRTLIAADFGAPTTRKRWYAVFRSDGKRICWPEQTHSKDGKNGLLPWVPVSNVLDFSDLGTSIFDRKKPLADATLKRIANGIEKFIANNPNPFFLTDQQALPFLIQYHSETSGSDVRGQAVTEPIKTIDTSNRYGLVSVFISKFYKTGTGQEVSEPLHTITTSPGHFGMVSVFLIKYYGTGNGQGVSEPLATITTKDRFGMVSTILLKNGEKYAIADIYLRMLKPEELKLAQGFPPDYVIDHDIDGNPYSVKDQVAKIGNSVVPIMAMKIAKANLDSNMPEVKDKAARHYSKQVFYQPVLL
jgi:DNA (cytosine-5)-methyltransferase 1